MRFTDAQDRLEAIAEYARNVVAIWYKPRADTPRGTAQNAAELAHAIELLSEALDSKP